MKEKVTKLNKTKVELSNGESFTIVHDFKNMNGNINSFDAAFQNWINRTDDYTAASFVKYVKNKEPERIFVTLEDYELTIKDKSEPSTKQEFESENN
jgi:major membrane immunogen (membrane-anchored lipoprotein)